MTRQLGRSLLGVGSTARWRVVLVGALSGLLAGVSWALDAVAPSAEEKVLQQAGVGIDDAGLLEFFHRRTVSAKDRQRVNRLIRQLGDDEFEKREKASADLQAIGRLAVPALTRALNDLDPEISRRAADCLQSIQQGGEQGLAVAACQVLARRKPAGAVPALLGYVPNAANDQVTASVIAALEQLALAEGKIDPSLANALTDEEAARRAAAAVVVARHSPGHRPAVRKLLADTDVGVRCAAALTLTTLGDKTAVETLLELFKDASPEQVWQVEDLLFRLAGDQARD